MLQLTIGPHAIEFPTGPDELNLDTWIEFVRAFGRDLDARAAGIDEMPAGLERHLQEMLLMVDRSYALAAFFAGIELQQAYDEMPVVPVVRLYRDLLPACFDVPQDLRAVTWNGIDYQLPEPALMQSSRMTFGEVLDSKAMLQNAVTMGWSQWELIQHLCAIFLRPAGQAYEERMAYLDGENVQAMGLVPMRVALMISRWYEQLNVFLEQSFTIFQGSAFKSGKHVSKYFASWGWVNFLKSVAKSKVFDIAGSGMNSIEAARCARAFDVLVWASDEKEYAEAERADYEAASK